MTVALSTHSEGDIMKTCNIDIPSQCDRTIDRHGAKGMCSLHYKRFRSMGDPYHVEPSRFNWDDVQYEAIHWRVRQHFGPAKTYSCYHCNQKAAHWALNWYGSPCVVFRFNGRNELLPCSLQLDDYIPLCVSCHKQMDLTQEEVTV